MDLCTTASTRKPNRPLCDENEYRRPTSAAVGQETVEPTSPQVRPMRKVPDTYRPRRLKTPYPILRTKDLKNMLGPEAPSPATAFQHVDSTLLRLRNSTLGAADVPKYSAPGNTLLGARPASSDSDLSLGLLASQVVGDKEEPSTSPFHLQPIASRAPLFRDSALAVRRWENLLGKKDLSSGHHEDESASPSPSHRDDNWSNLNDTLDWFPGFSAIPNATLSTGSVSSPALESSDGLPLPSPASRNPRSYMTEDEYMTMVSGEIESIARMNERIDAMIERSEKLLEEGKRALSQDVEFSNEFDLPYFSKSEDMVMSKWDRTYELDAEGKPVGIDQCTTPARRSKKAVSNLPERDPDTLSLEDSCLGSPFSIIRATTPESLDSDELQIRSKRMSGRSVRHTGRLPVPQGNRLANSNLIVSRPAALAPLLAPVTPLSPLVLPSGLFNLSASEFESSSESDENDFSAALVQAVLASKYDIRAPIEAVFHAMSRRTKAIFDIAFLTDKDGEAARHAMLLIKRSLREWARMQNGAAERATGVY